MAVYNKLVRDLIPEIIENNGKTYTSRILSDSEYINAINQKLKEEMEELIAVNSTEQVIEESADVLEVLYALLESHGVLMNQVEQARVKKKEQRGGFQGRIFLEEVSE